MACAIPVIASPIGANVDAVPPSCGILASSSDEWPAAFRQLAADPVLEGGDSGGGGQGGIGARRAYGF